MSAHAPRSPGKLDRHWLAEAIRLTESHAGPLEDAEANRRARAAGGDLDRRILTRAQALAERDGLAAALGRWRQGAALVLAAMGLVAVALGIALAVAALEGAEPVNVFWALGSLLGIHLATLAGWGLTLGGAGGGLVGRVWLWLAGRLARDARGVQLGPALLSLLTRSGLGRWGLGALVHLFWLLVLAIALLGLLTLLSARRYGFTWETTLLSADTFVTLTRAIGALPALAGFPLPDAETVRATNTVAGGDAARRAWAGWLLGALVVYGIVPRLLLAALCAWRWLRGLGALAIDPALPEYVALRERLLPGSESLGVSEPEQPDAGGPDAPAGAAAGTGAMLVAVELDGRHPWPPALPDAVRDAGIVNSRGQRTRLLEALAQAPPARLAIACDPQRSVDRGTVRLIAELARLAVAARVWLVAPPAGATVDEARLEEWRSAIHALGLEAVDDAPLGWLEGGRD